MTIMHKYGTFCNPMISMTKEQKKALIIKSTITGPQGQTSKQKIREKPIYVPNEWDYLNPPDQAIRDRLTNDEILVENKYAMFKTFKKAPKRIVPCRNTRKYEHKIVEMKPPTFTGKIAEVKKVKQVQTKYFYPQIHPTMLTHVNEYDCKKFVELLDRCARKRKDDVSKDLMYFYHKEEDAVTIAVSPQMEEAIVKGNIYNVILSNNGEKITLCMKRGPEIKLKVNTMCPVKFPKLVESGQYKPGEGEEHEVNMQKPLTMKEAKKKKIIDANRAQKWLDEENRQCELISKGELDIHQLIDDSEIDINQLISTGKIDLMQLALSGILDLHRLIDGGEIDIRQLIENKTLNLKELIAADKIEIQRLLDENLLDINALIKEEYVDIQELIEQGLVDTYKLMKEYKIELLKLMDDKRIDIHKCLHTNSLDITTLYKDFKIDIMKMIMDEKINLQELIDDGKIGLAHLCLDDINGYGTTPLKLDELIRKGKIDFPHLVADETFDLNDLIMDDRVNFQELVDTEILDLESLIWEEKINVQQLVLDGKYDFHPHIIDGKFDFPLMIEMGKIYLDELFEADKTSSKRLHKCLGKIGLEENHIKALLGEKLPTPPPGQKPPEPPKPKPEPEIPADAKKLIELFGSGKPFTIDDLKEILKDGNISKEALLLLLQSDSEAAAAMIAELMQPGEDGEPPACAALLGQLMKPPKSLEEMIELLKDPEAAQKLLRNAAKKTKAPGAKKPAPPIKGGMKLKSPEEEAKIDALLETVIQCGVEAVGKTVPKKLLLDILKDDEKQQKEIAQQSTEMLKFLSTSALLISNNNQEQINALKEFMIAGQRMSKRASKALEPVFGKDKESALINVDKFKTILCPASKKKSNPLISLEIFGKALDKEGTIEPIHESMVTGMLILQVRRRGQPPSDAKDPADIMTEFFVREAARRDPLSAESLRNMWSADATRVGGLMGINIGGVEDQISQLRKLLRGGGRKKSSGARKKSSGASKKKSSASDPNKKPVSHKHSDAGAYDPYDNISYMADDDHYKREAERDGSVSAKTSYERSRYLRKRSHLLHEMFDETDGIFLRQQYRI